MIIYPRTVGSHNWGTPIAGWLFPWTILSRSGWQLGVPLWPRKPPYVFITFYNWFVGEPPLWMIWVSLSVGMMNSQCMENMLQITNQTMVHRSIAIHIYSCVTFKVGLISKEIAISDTSNYIYQVFFWVFWHWNARLTKDV